MTHEDLDRLEEQARAWSRREDVDGTTVGYLAVHSGMLLDLICATRKFDKQRDCIEAADRLAEAALTAPLWADNCDGDCRPFANPTEHTTTCGVKKLSDALAAYQHVRKR